MCCIACKLNNTKTVNILITGGTGMIGRQLTKILLQNGHKVSYLSRKKENIPDVKVYTWNLETGVIEADALKDIEVIVHLAGAGIADKRWTEKQKQEIIDSRIKPIQLLNEQLQKQQIKIKSFISASGIGYYGGDTGETKVNENSPAGNDFLAVCTKIWELETKKFSQADRKVSIRTGVVLSTTGGALPKILQPIKLGVGAPLGSGKQWMSWIHIDDICQLYLKAIEDSTMQGAYNAVAPTPVRNKEFTQTAAKVLKKPLWLPNIPAFVLKLIFGELSITILGGNYVANKRLAEETSFIYRFPTLEGALQDLLV